MKITKKTLRKIIQEELKGVLREVHGPRGARAFQATDYDWDAPGLGGYQQDLPDLENPNRTFGSPDEGLQRMFDVATRYQSMVLKHGGASQGPAAAALFDPFLEKLADLQSASDEEKIDRVQSGILQQELNLILKDAGDVASGKHRLPKPGHFTIDKQGREDKETGQQRMWEPWQL